MVATTGSRNAMVMYATPRWIVRRRHLMHLMLCQRRSSRRDRSRSRSVSRSRRRSHSPRAPRRSRRSRSRSNSRSRSRSRGGKRSSEPFPRSLGGPMNAPHEEAVEFAKESRRERRVYVGNLSYDTKYRDLIEFMRGGGLGTQLLTFWFFSSSSFTARV